MNDDIMEQAFADLADELEVQDAELLQEAADVLTVWGWVRTHHHAHMSAGFIVLNGLRNTFRSDTFDDDYLHAAAEWVRQQEGE